MNREPTLQRILIAAAAALTVGFGGVSLITGFSQSAPVRMIQGVAVFAAGAIVLGGVIVLSLVQFAGWQEPESEQDFEAIVQRAERLAAWGQTGALVSQVEDDDAANDDEFRALVRAALDELPLEFHRVLEHVAIVISDGGRQRRAYGLYEGDTVARDFFHDRIVIFRDTLMQDFGHDPELLKAQVVRTVRHELAHHLGWGEKGVRGLGL
jgi:predicted Zn-dependent protease with MMP-like domain